MWYETKLPQQERLYAIRILFKVTIERFVIPSTSFQSKYDTFVNNFFSFSSLVHFTHRVGLHGLHGFNVQLHVLYMFFMYVCIEDTYIYGFHS